MNLRTNSALRCSLTCIGLLVALNAAQAAEGWARLRLGMSGSEVVAVLGRPLISSQGHGIQRWIDDCGGEVLIPGLVDWLDRAGMAGAARSTDIWQAAREETAAPVVALSSPAPSPDPLAPVGRRMDWVAGNGAVKPAVAVRGTVAASRR